MEIACSAYGVQVTFSEDQDSPPRDWVSSTGVINHAPTFQTQHTPVNTSEEHKPILANSPAKPALPPVAATLQPTARAKRRRPLFIALVTLIVILVIGSGLGAFLLLAHKNSRLPAASSPVVGHVFFASSGKTGQNSSQGIVDTLTIDLKNIPPPPAGKSYYAWLLGDNSDSEAQPILLGRMSIEHGLIHFSYAGDQQHDDLIANTSRFLITAEDSTITPIVPTTDLSARLYYATIPQIQGSQVITSACLITCGTFWLKTQRFVPKGSMAGWISGC